MNIEKGGKPPRNNLEGKKFGSWTVKTFIGRNVVKGKSRTYKDVVYECECICGSKSVVRRSDLVAGKTSKCSDCRITEFKKRNSLREYSLHADKNPNWRGTQDIPRDFYSQFKRNAEVRNLPFEVSIEDLQELWEKQEGLCAYTGRTLHFKRNRVKKKGRHEGSSNIASLDRIDSDKGYIKGNIQFVAAPVNLAKQTYCEIDFLNLIQEIYDYKIRDYW